jgi:uncharacterized protein DUF4384
MKLKLTPLSLLSVAVVLFLASSGLAQQQAETPTYQEGEFWQFSYRSWGWLPLTYDSRRISDGIYEVVYSQNQFRTFYYSSEGKEELSPPNPKIMYLINPGQDIQFPLAPGKTWSYEYNHFVDLGMGAGTNYAFFHRVVQLTVGKRQSISTDAGAFNAFRVVKENRLHGAPSGPRTTYFFSPQTRSVVRINAVELADIRARAARSEAVLIKHGVDPGGPNLVGEPKAGSEGQKQVKFDKPSEVKGAPIISASRPSQEQEAVSKPVSFALEPPQDISSPPATVPPDSPPVVKTEVPDVALPITPRPSASSPAAGEQVALLKQPAPSSYSPSFNLEMNIIAQRKERDGNYIEVFVNEGSTLRSRDNFQIHLKSSRPAYIYILIYDSEGKASQLFPDPKIEESGFVQEGQSLAVPGPESWFWLDDNTGTETIYVLASENPMADIRGLLAKMQTADDAGQQRAAQEIKERIAVMQRGVGGITKGQAAIFTLSDGKKIQKVTDVVTGTGSVVRVVSFLHR